MSVPKAAILVSTYQRPHHLRRALAAIAQQDGLEQGLEVIVSDDGSQDETPQVVERFAANVDFPVRFTTHPHDGFHLARCRNEGAAASRAPFLLFLDGDCLIPPDHLARCLRRSRRGVVTGGYCCYLDRATSERVTEESIRFRRYLGDVPRRGRLRLMHMDLKARWYNLIRHPTKPKLFGGNIGIWREDFERVNGYDESYRGWGCEDDDLRLRLRRAGVRLKPLAGGPRTVHLWHPPGASTPPTWRQGPNVDYFARKFRLSRCINGLRKRDAGEVSVRVVADTAQMARAAALLESFGLRLDPVAPPEVEILFLPGNGRFSGRADCNILVVLEDSPSAARLARRAHLVVARRAYPGVPPSCRFGPDQLDRAFRAALGQLPSFGREDGVRRLPLSPPACRADPGRDPCQSRRAG